MKKVLFICSLYHPHVCGIETMITELACFYKKQGIESITMTCEKKNKGLYEKLGFKVIFENSKGNCFMTKVHGGENKENKPFCNTVKAQNNKIFSRN